MSTDSQANGAIAPDDLRRVTDAFAQAYLATLRMPNNALQFDIGELVVNSRLDALRFNALVQELAQANVISKAAFDESLKRRLETITAHLLEEAPRLVVAPGPLPKS